MKWTLLILHLRKSEVKRILFIPQIRKVEAERTLFIPQIGKIKAKRSLFIPQIWKIKAEQTLFIPQIRKIKAKQSLFIPKIRKIQAEQTPYSRNRQDRSEKNELERSKTNRGGILKTFMSPRIDSKELIPPAYALAGLNNNPIPARFLAPLGCSKVPAPCWYF